jgi:hypothetical protein
MAELAGLLLPSATRTSSPIVDGQVLRLAGVLRKLGAKLEERDEGAIELRFPARVKAGTSLREGGEIDRLVRYGDSRRRR